ncbi:uncharacterized protein LOC131065057 isoform X2 [Cryptomeria japonica]|uniref:uncharacterized protein LOC131065057 isoform X2 n=1 Tax=Cryptomeria japonica TaxID=3369 RepID=UPI0025AC05BE|nr:uncharacterized protein LOC131065057 isoform X2 [Cryptomeria japonica]
MEISPSPPKKTERTNLFLRHAMRRKHSFVHLVFMGGIFLLSMKTTGQNYRISELLEEKAALQEEQLALLNKFGNLKQKLLNEAETQAQSSFSSSLHALLAELPAIYQLPFILLYQLWDPWL